jgi:hypothetical protein
MAVLATRLPVYQPAMRIISSVTNANPAVVTTTFNHQYSSGLIVRLNIPSGYGMQQANQLYGPIIVTGDTTFTIDIDTSFFDPLIIPLNVGTTDGSGDASSTVSGNLVAVEIGQSFIIGDQVYYIVNQSGDLATTSSGSGTFNISTLAFTFTGANPDEDIFLNQVPLPFNYQYPTVVPMGEINETVYLATKNVLPYRAS